MFGATVYRTLSFISVGDQILIFLVIFIVIVDGFALYVGSVDNNRNIEYYLVYLLIYLAGIIYSLDKFTAFTDSLSI